LVVVVVGLIPAVAQATQLAKPAAPEVAVQAVTAPHKPVGYLYPVKVLPAEQVKLRRTMALVVAVAQMQ
jgi:hypothetical protein